MTIKALVMGLTHEQVAVLVCVNEDSVSRWVRRFNERGIDGLTEGLRSGFPPNIGAERSDEYRKLVLHPELVKEAHWTGRKFHGYLSQQCKLEVGYSTLMRWLHDEGFRIKVPRPWPDGQDEEKRKAFIELIRTISRMDFLMLFIITDLHHVLPIFSSDIRSRKNSSIETEQAVI